MRLLMRCRRASSSFATTVRRASFATGIAARRETDNRKQGAGYDQVDVSACLRKHIKVSHTPAVVNDSTADTTMFLILGALRRLNLPMRTLRDGSWRGHCPPPLGHDPEGKTLGILGMGGIGRNLCRKAQAFGMRIIYHNRNELDKEQGGVAEFVTFEDLLEQSDVISVNLPLNVSGTPCFNIRAYWLHRVGKYREDFFIDFS
jgi:glyoxylate reductase